MSAKEAIDLQELIGDIEASIENRIISSGTTITKETGP
jgi:hypothetical protein